MMICVEDFKNGYVLLIDKPLGWTSFQVVKKIRWSICKSFCIKKIKVGHAGTLDPLATGLLVICTGKQTKNISTYQSELKEYVGSFTVGATTLSYDLETAINQTFSIEHITEDLIYSTAKKFTGVIEQKPPIFSAIKKNGKRLYEFARKNESVDIKPRKVTIFTFEITQVTLPKINFKIVCSKGTYIRSIANDFGIALRSGAHLSYLRRTKIGSFSVDQALTIQNFTDSLPGLTI